MKYAIRNVVSWYMMVGLIYLVGGDATVIWSVLVGWLVGFVLGTINTIQLRNEIERETNCH